MAAQQRRSGDRATNFAMACNFLSQYVKDNTFGAPAKGKSENFQAPVTMKLLPGVDVSAGRDEGRNELELFPQRPMNVDEERIKPSGDNNSQLTIFFGGKVMVFDDFSAQRADNLIEFAKKASSTTQSFRYVSPSASVHENKIGNPRVSSQHVFPNLPLSRKASLQRFFEKRKDRINASAPYSLSGCPKKATPAKSEESASWLGLVPQVSMKGSFCQSSDCSK